MSQVEFHPHSNHNMTNCWSDNLRMNTISQSEKRTNGCNQVCRMHCPQVPPLCAPHYTDTGSDSTDEHRSYNMMGLYLRANVFPGPSVVWSSLVKDSFTRHHLPAFIQDAVHSYGHKTDHLVKWTEQNFLNKRLHKLLKEMEFKGVSK